MKKLLKFIISIVICEMAGLIGAIFTTPKINTWYATLNKPSFTPPGYFIGLVWNILFFLMGIALYLVWSKNWIIEVLPENQKRKAWNRFSEKLWFGSWREENTMAIFFLQLFLNILWSVIFFGCNHPALPFLKL